MGLPGLEPALLAIGLAGPTAAAWWYFVLLEGQPAARIAYLASKGVQFLLPLTALPWIARDTPWEGRHERGRCARLGLASGGLLALPMLLVYELWLHGSTLAKHVAPQVAGRMSDFGVSGPLPYLAFALALSLGHSALEEVYWRWFLFRRLRHHLGQRAGVALSSLGFMAHHVIVLAAFLRGLEISHRTVLLVLFSTGVAAAGALWAVLYARCGRLLAPWLSHALVDLAILTIGARLVFSA